MAEITVRLPEPIMARLREQARQVEMPLENLVAQQLLNLFHFTIFTAAQARRKALKTLRDYSGYLLRIGKPVFDEKTFQWRMPVLPNLRGGKARPLGELCLSAETGEVLTETDALREMVHRAMPLFGVQRMDERFQKRLDDLMTRNNNGELSEFERRELERLVQQLQENDLENARRLVENVQLPPRKRAEAQNRESQVQILLNRLKKQGEAE